METVNAGQTRSPALEATNSADGFSSLVVHEEDRAPHRTLQRRRTVFTTWPILVLGSVVGLVLVIAFLQLWPGFMGRPQRATVAPVAAISAKPDLQQLPAAGLDPTEQVAAYLDGLKAGRYRFDEFETGAEIGRSLGYTSALFDSVYKELAHRVRIRVKRDLSAPNEIVLGHLESILRDEEAIKALIGRRDPRTVASIAYLRDLQFGKANFPNPLVGKPSGRELLLSLATMHPDARIEPNDMFFIVVYERTVDQVESQMRTAGFSSIYKVISEFRRNIVTSSLALDPR